MRSILVPVAPGERPAHLRRAVRLARQSGAEIILLCVNRGREAPTDHPALAQLAEEAPDIAARSLCADGHPPREILRAARREKADLIVMGLDPKWRTGPSDERGFRRFLIGSTAATVVQGAPCPVWLEKTASCDDIVGLVCVLEMKGDNDSLVRYAARIAQDRDARLVLFHSAASTLIFGPNQPPKTLELQRNLVEQGHREIDRLRTQYAASATKVVTTGYGVQALAGTLKDTGSALVVIDRVSDRWGDNNKIYDIVRYCDASVLIRAEARAEAAAMPATHARPGAAFSTVLILAAMALGFGLLFLIFQNALHTDMCQAAQIRCQTSTDVLFSRDRSSATPP